MTYEEEILAKHSAPRLRRNILPRAAKKLNMEFDAQFSKMTKADRDAFLDAIYPEDVNPKGDPDDGNMAGIRTDPGGDAGSGEVAASKEKAAHGEEATQVINEEDCQIAKEATFSFGSDWRA